MELNAIIWLVIVAIMLVIEIFTMGLTTIWFSLGAVAAAIAAGMGAPLWVQVLLFALVSLIIMLLVRPFAIRVVNRDRAKTNVEALVGEEALVIETIDNQNEKGKVTFRGVEWTARSVDGGMIPEGRHVVVDEVSGVKMLVRQKQ